MIPNYKNVHLKFKLNNHHYSFEDLMEVAYSFVKEGEPYQQELGGFLLDWLDFCAMTPMQLSNFLNHVDHFKTIIIGGSRVPKTLINAVKDITCHVYETYGMTETVTHIAIKKLNNFESESHSNNYFKTLPGVKISQDDRDCLVIEAPKLYEGKIVTNDI